LTFVNLYVSVLVVSRKSNVKNRHISLQYLSTADEIRRQIANSWFLIDSLSDGDNDNPATIQNGIIKLRFARLNGDGISKHVVIQWSGAIIYLGEVQNEKNT
jgi:hypothetical protein